MTTSFLTPNPLPTHARGAVDGRALLSQNFGFTLVGQASARGPICVDHPDVSTTSATRESLCLGTKRAAAPGFPFSMTKFHATE